eukprot:m.132918 g.132918  ORF g.132918 m.132918 type:complete len:375 (+) comp17513_c1_seq1:436-1560(+)
MAVSTSNTPFPISFANSHGADVSFYDLYAATDTKSNEAPSLNVNSDLLSFIGADDRAAQRNTFEYLPLRDPTESHAQEVDDEIMPVMTTNYFDISTMLPGQQAEHEDCGNLLSPVFSDDSDSSSGGLWFEGGDDHAVPDMLRENSLSMQDITPLTSNMSFADYDPSKPPSHEYVCPSSQSSLKDSNQNSTAVACKNRKQTSMQKKKTYNNKVPKKISKSIRQHTEARKNNHTTGKSKVRAATPNFSAITPPSFKSYFPKVPQMDYSKQVVRMIADANVMGPPKFPVQFSKSINATATHQVDMGLTKGGTGGAIDETPTDRLKKMEGNRRAAKKFRLKQKAKEHELHLTAQRLEKANADMRLELSRIMQIKANRS